MSKGHIVTWQAIVIVFVASACTLVIELIAGRLLAPYIGVNLYTWTSIIGVVLAGISLGNYAGGWLADRQASRGLLGLQFFASALATLSILPLLSLMVDNSGGRGMPLVVRVLLYVTVIFFLPGFVMGTISPVVIKLSLTDLERTGKTVGLIYAFSTLGSILGTFVTGFWLISAFGTRVIVFGVAAVLALMGLIFGGIRLGRAPATAVLQLFALVASAGGGWLLVSSIAALSVRYGEIFSQPSPFGLPVVAIGTVVLGGLVSGVIVVIGLAVMHYRALQLGPEQSPVYIQATALGTIALDRRQLPFFVQVAALGAVAAGLAYGVQTDRHKSPFYRETDYYTINVSVKIFTDGTKGLSLVLDRLIHSFSDPTDPTRLEYGYERVYREVTALKAEAHPAMRTAFIGGGGYTYPRFIEAVYPRSTVHVVEIDPAVTEVAYERLGVARDSRIVTFNEDARLFFNRFGEGAATEAPYDIVFGDAFNDIAVPYHLTTAEFAGLVHKALAPDGIYMVNIIDSYQRGEFVRAYMRSLKLHFPYVYLIGLGEAWRSPSASTYIVVGAKQPLDQEGLRRVATQDGKNMESAILPAEEQEAYLASGRQIYLTDDYVPVDQLLAWLFEERGF